jgi:hypothetical protein
MASAPRVLDDPVFPCDAGLQWKWGDSWTTDASEVRAGHQIDADPIAVGIQFDSDGRPGASDVEFRGSLRAVTTEISYLQVRAWSYQIPGSQWETWVRLQLDTDGYLDSSNYITMYFPSNLDFRYRLWGWIGPTHCCHRVELTFSPNILEQCAESGCRDLTLKREFNCAPPPTRSRSPTPTRSKSPTATGSKSPSPTISRTPSPAADQPPGLGNSSAEDLPSHAGNYSDPFAPTAPFTPLSFGGEGNGGDGAVSGNADQGKAMVAGLAIEGVIIVILAVVVVVLIVKRRKPSGGDELDNLTAE